jgi:DNA-binding LytR/AlgR family response regulator
VDLGAGDAGALPLPADQIERVEAAGNYVEIRRRSGPVLVHRASLAAIERELVRHGFVRIHRSHLVRRDAIARIRPADVILRDGTSLRTGKRFRTTLRD